jgi:predicted RNA-binding protein with PUA-like domain
MAKSAASPSDAAGSGCWLLKSEPDAYSIADLARDRRTAWSGVRNYQARNFLRDGLKVGDRVLFYHSNAAPPGVAGVARVCRAAYPDHTAWQAGGPTFDPRSTPAAPVWMMVDVAFVEQFPRVVSLDELRARPELRDLLVLRRGQRLSVQPVEPRHFDLICRMGRKGTRPV